MRRARVPKEFFARPRGAWIPPGAAPGGGGAPGGLQRTVQDARKGQRVAAKFMLHGSNSVLILLSAAVVLAAAFGVMHVPVWLVAIGAALFYLTEYSTHRFMFHAQPSRFAWLRAKQHRLHYDHHVEPTRLDLLFLPLWYVVPNLIVTSAIAYALLRDVGWAAALVLGAMLALLHYEWVHFIAHMPYTPKTAFGRWMKRYHLRHHFVNEKRWYGVSNPVMDLLYGTYGDPRDGTRSKTTRVLYPDGPGPQ
jgi:4-hydroxysphinganine ceramide fatty acyl 2-hydroxylase